MSIDVISLEKLIQHLGGEEDNHIRSRLAGMNYFDFEAFSECLELDE